MHFQNTRCVVYQNFDPLRILRRGSNFHRFFVLPKLSIKTESKHAKKTAGRSCVSIENAIVYCGSNPRFETAFRNEWTCKFQHEDGVLKIAFSTRCVSAKRILGH